MVELEQQTWVTLVGLAGFTLTLLGYLAAMKRDLRREILDFRSELKGDIGESRTELKGELGESRTELKGEIAELRAETRSGFETVESRLIALEDRTYELAMQSTPKSS